MVSSRELFPVLVGGLIEEKCESFEPIDALGRGEFLQLAISRERGLAVINEEKSVCHIIYLNIPACMGYAEAR